MGLSQAKREIAHTEAGFSKQWHNGSIFVRKYFQPCVQNAEAFTECFFRKPDSRERGLRDSIN